MNSRHPFQINNSENNGLDFFLPEVEIRRVRGSQKSYYQFNPAAASTPSVKKKEKENLLASSTCVNLKHSNGAEELVHKSQPSHQQAGFILSGIYNYSSLIPHDNLEVIYSDDEQAPVTVFKEKNKSAKKNNKNRLKSTKVKTGISKSKGHQNNESLDHIVEEFVPDISSNNDHDVNPNDKVAQWLNGRVEKTNIFTSLQDEEIFEISKSSGAKRNLKRKANNKNTEIVNTVVVEDATKVTAKEKNNKKLPQKSNLKKAKNENGKKLYAKDAKTLVSNILREEEVMKANQFEKLNSKLTKVEGKLTKSNEIKRDMVMETIDFVARGLCGRIDSPNVSDTLSENCGNLERSALKLKDKHPSPEKEFVIFDLKNINDWRPVKNHDGVFYSRMVKMDEYLSSGYLKILPQKSITRVSSSRQCYTLIRGTLEWSLNDCSRNVKPGSSVFILNGTSCIIKNKSKKEAIILYYKVLSSLGGMSFSK